MICLSIVSHGQIGLVKKLLTSLGEQCSDQNVAIVLTVNTTDEHSTAESVVSTPFPLEIVRNHRPKGFGANHNAAFDRCRSDFFCILNPDILFVEDPFPALCAVLGDPSIGAVAPKLFDSAGRVQDNGRHFPTPLRILKRRLVRGRYADSRGEADLLFPDWIAGMFMLIRSSVFLEAGGFDEHYFMYCEDADLCCRMRRLGFGVALCRRAAAIHDARRNSHRKPAHLYWHLSSLLRFFLYHRQGGRQPCVPAHQRRQLP